MQSFFTRFYSLVLPVSNPPILIERFFLDAHFGRKSTIKSDHNPTWRAKGMPYHSLHNTVTSNSIFSSTILTICQACVAIFQWQPITTICVRHLPLVFWKTSAQGMTKNTTFYSPSANSHFRNLYNGSFNVSLVPHTNPILGSHVLRQTFSRRQNSFLFRLLWVVGKYRK